MTVDKIKKVIEYAINVYNAEDFFPLEYSEYHEKIYNPIKEAIRNNDVDVVEYLMKCSAEDRRYILSAIINEVEEDGIIKENTVRLGFNNVAKLYQKVCEEFKILQDAD